MNLNILTVQDAATITDAVKRSRQTATQIAEQGKDRPDGETPQVAADDLYAQVIKYIPTPLLGLYLIAVNAALSGLSGDGERIALWAIFVVFALAVVGFLRNRRVKRWGQVGISLLAFVAWVAASPGPFQAIKDYPQVIGTFALLAVVLVGLVFRLDPLKTEELEASKPTP